MDMSAHTHTHTNQKVKIGTHSRVCMSIQHSTTQFSDKQEINYFIFNLNMLSHLEFSNKKNPKSMSYNVKRSILLCHGADFLYLFSALFGLSFILSFCLELKIDLGRSILLLTGRTFNVLHAFHLIKIHTFLCIIHFLGRATGWPLIYILIFMCICGAQTMLVDNFSKFAIFKIDKYFYREWTFFC